MGGLNPTIALILGLLTAGSVHAVKATARPVFTVTTAGLANPLVSILEDLVAAAVTVLALVAPVLAALVFLVLLVVAIRVVASWRRRRAARA